MTTPRDSDWLESRRRELQEWHATLSEWEEKTLDRIIEHKVEQYFLDILGHLKNQLGYVRSL